VQLKNHHLLVLILQTGLETAYHTKLPQVNEEPEARLRALASAVSVSPLWRETPRAVLVIRLGPDPLLSVVGYFDDASRTRLEGLRWQLDHVMSRLRYVDYAQAEKDCEQLASRIVERFGRDELQNFRFTAIPRGGLIVLGMLAYTLGLQRSQLEPSHSPGTPLVVVDDCALSGVRIGEYLEHSQSRRIIFAHLYSPPQLRNAIETAEARRVTCVSAHDLRDYAPEYQGDGYLTWRKRWLDRMDGRAYWVGQPEPLCFAWNEPDRSVWNPITNREETGWRLVPPELCLQNRPAPDAKPVEVQVQPEGKEPLKPSAHVVFAEFEGQVVVGDVTSEESFVLDGVGADMWRAIVQYGNLKEVEEALLTSYEVDSATLLTDLRGFVEDLLSRGLLENNGG